MRESAIFIRHFERGHLHDDFRILQECLGSRLWALQLISRRFATAYFWRHYFGCAHAATADFSPPARRSP